MTVAKGYDALLPFAERIARRSSEYSSAHISAIEAYIRAVKEMEDLRARIFPMSTLSKEERLRKVAAHCGLAMPSVVTSSEQAFQGADQASDMKTNAGVFTSTSETPSK